MAIISFGSINMDLVAQAQRLPQPGETLTARSFITAAGGKGANQAVAAARLGAAVTMVGRVGADGFGAELLANLRQSGVQCDRVWTDPDTTSGLALITVDDASENQIVLVPGANYRLDHTDLARLEQALTAAQILLLQLEVPLSAVVDAARLAHGAGVTVILDPAPARSDLPEALYSLIGILTPNQIEAAQLVGFAVETPAAALQAAQVLQQKGVRSVIVKLGSKGAVGVGPEGVFTVPPFPVAAVDTVAAGDCFNGALAVGLAEGRSLPDAALQASAAAALSVTQSGAQPSLPTRSQLQTFLEQTPPGAPPLL